MITLPVLCCRAAAAGPGADQHCSAWLCLWGHIPTTPMPVGLLLNTIIQRKLWLRNKSHCSTEAVRGSSNRGKGSTLLLVISFVVQGYAYLSEAFSPCPLLLPALLSPASNPSHWCKADLSRETSHKASSLGASWLVQSHAGRWHLPTHQGRPHASTPPLSSTSPWNRKRKSPTVYKQDTQLGDRAAPAGTGWLRPPLAPHSWVGSLWEQRESSDKNLKVSGFLDSGALSTFGLQLLSSERIRILRCSIIIFLS